MLKMGLTMGKRSDIFVLLRDKYITFGRMDNEEEELERDCADRVYFGGVFGRGV